MFRTIIKWCSIFPFPESALSIGNFCFGKNNYFNGVRVSDIHAVVREIVAINQMDLLKIHNTLLEKWICKTGSVLAKVRFPSADKHVHARCFVVTCFISSLSAIFNLCLKRI